jgi:hypothetical protein
MHSATVGMSAADEALSTEVQIYIVGIKDSRRNLDTLA